MLSRDTLTELASRFMNAVLNGQRSEAIIVAKKLHADRWTKDMNTSRCVELLSQVETETQLMNVLSAASPDNSFVILRGDPLVEACASTIVSDKVYEMAKNKGLRSYVNLVQDTLKRYSDDRVVEGIKRYTRVFNPLAEMIGEILENLSFKELFQHRENARRYLKEMYDHSTAKVATPPEYLVKVSSQEHRRSLDRVMKEVVEEFDLEKSTILTKSELAQRYVASTIDDESELSQRVAENPELVKKIVEIQFDTLEPLEQYKLVEPWLLPGIEKPDSTEFIFNHYGPLCGFATEVDCEVDDKFNDCYTYGHRMLKCNCSLIRSDYMCNGFIHEQYEWFTGVCDKCASIIEKKHYATRLPDFDGAKVERWIGCYCSIKCATKAAAQMYPEDDDHQAIYNTIVNDIFYQLRNTGIYDSE